MAILSRLFPAWKTPVLFAANKQGSFGWIFQWLERLFKKPAIEAVPKSTPNLIQTEQVGIPEVKAAMNITPVARFATQVSSKRTPLIKFLGPRSPKPHFDSSKLPPIPKSSASASTFSKATPSAAKPATSIGKIGTTPRGSGIDDTQLPLRFRRRPIDEEEIAAINNGGAYGL